MENQIKSIGQTVSEHRKRRRERIAILLLAVLFFLLTIAEFRLTRVSSTLPFVNSIFFFGLLNINIVLLIALFWLIFRNIGKLFLERRSRVLGARLKTKLVVAFLAFSITPTLILFVISSFYINSSFDKWFSIKIQNTLQASLEITGTYYRNAERTTKHFAEHLANQLSKHPAAEESINPITAEAIPKWVGKFLEDQRELLALNAVEFYGDPFDERFLSQEGSSAETINHYPRLSLDILDKAFGGEVTTVTQRIGTGDLIRCLMPVRIDKRGPVVGVVVVDAYIPISLVNKVGEIAGVFEDYKGTNPLKYPIKTAYFVILVMITLVLIFVAVWIGLYLARELTVPVERLVRGAQQVGSGNLDVSIEAAGQDEIAVLVDSFNKMTRDLKDNRARLTQASVDLEARKIQLEAVLANIGTGVIVVGRDGVITTFNRAAAQLLEIAPDRMLHARYDQALSGETVPLVELIERAFKAFQSNKDVPAEITHWNFKAPDNVRALAGIATPLRDAEAHWGVVVVIDDMSHLIKAQREVAWREVARRIAHEIKNPLTPIKLSAQRLQRRLGHYRGKEGEVLKECTETIVKHTDELKEMVNEFSNFARFPEITPAPNDIAKAIRETLTLFKQAHPQISMTFEPDTRMPTFEFDREQIKRVVMNLLDNAISALNAVHTAKLKEIRIQTHYNEALQMAVVSVEDNGPGMEEDVRSRVFEPSISTKQDGTGLGLAI
ncbi:MAG: PAS domain-containing sensor histidine kinase, partial [Bacteriovoracia bacterium]